MAESGNSGSRAGSSGGGSSRGGSSRGGSSGGGSSRGGSSGGGSSGGGSSRSGSSRGNSRAKRFSAPDAVAAVREAFPALLGRPIESVLGVERDEEEGWRVTVQVIELERIPRSTDVLGAYIVTLDEDGELVGYRRRRRYNRSAADED
jgi:hypothetical protein